MRNFLSAIIIIVLTLTVNASTMYQRAPKVNFKTCVIDLNALRPIVITSTKTFNGLTFKSTVTSRRALFEDSGRLAVALQKASRSCCFPFVRNINKNLKNNVFNEAAKFVTEAEAIVGSFTRLHESTIAQRYGVYFPELILNVQESATTLNRCLVERSPKEKMAATTILTTNLNTAFEKLRSRFPELRYAN